MNEESQSIKCGDILVAVKEDVMASSCMENFILSAVWDFTFEEGDVFFVIDLGKERVSNGDGSYTIYPIEYCVLLTRFGVAYADIYRFGKMREVACHSL